MPPLQNGDYLVEMLFKAGPMLVDTMGSAPLTHEEIYFWQHNTGARLSAWEAGSLHGLSFAYWLETQAAAKRDAEAPWAAADARPPKTAFQLRMAALRAL
ncbi:MAG: hypothetical protein ABI790_02310 [Betaproteobacteria bacterium]